MDVRFELNGQIFVWNEEKALVNILEHDGIRFEEAAAVFFDPFLVFEDASRNDEERDAAIGYDARQRLLYVVHIEFEDDHIRIISARKAEPKERQRYDL